MKKESKRHICPYCDEEIAAASFPFCQTCKVDILKCPRCGKTLSRDNEVCPHCGAKIKGALPSGD